MLEEIPNKSISHLCLVIDVNLHKKNGKYYIEIIIPQSDVPISYHGSYHCRSGSTKQELKGTVLQQFILKKMGKSWDNIPIDSASTDVLDVATINLFLKLSIIREELIPIPVRIAYRNYFKI